MMTAPVRNNSERTYRNDEPTPSAPVDLEQTLEDIVRTGLIGEDEAETYRVIQTEEEVKRKTAAEEEERLIKEAMLAHMNNYRDALKQTYSEIMTGGVSDVKKETR
jgi:hypothetical protein